MMPDLRFHHVGVGTTHFDEAIAVYESLGYRRNVVVDDPELNVRVALVSLEGGPFVEIVAPLRAGGPLASFIARRMLPSPYHTCYSTVDLDSTGAKLRTLGFMRIGSPQPALAFGGARIVYHYHRAVGLVELLEDAASR